MGGSTKVHKIEENGDICCKESSSAIIVIPFLFNDKQVRGCIQNAMNIYETFYDIHHCTYDKLSQNNSKIITAEKQLNIGEK